MANELRVDAAGLRSAANSSDSIAAGLSGVGAGNPTATHASAAGVAAMNAALTSTQNRQSARITGQAGNLTTSSALYDATDTEGRDTISGTVRV
ncbi:type VII secretion target [Mycobacteroides abscessus]|uniref:type VII secretion target n=1 Tax=Mycobacteroides abscessus TaxID=36809 RepID=UPI003AABD2A3